MLAVVGEVMGLLELEELCQGLLFALREAVPSDYCAMNEVPAEAPTAVSLTDPPVSPDLHVAFARYGPQNPLVQHFQRTRDGRPMRLSDVTTRRELHELELYREIYKPMGVEYQLAFTLPSLSDRVLGVALEPLPARLHRRRAGAADAGSALPDPGLPQCPGLHPDQQRRRPLDRRGRPHGPGADPAPSRGSAPSRDGAL